MTTQSPPKLSIVMRTQARRVLAMDDALLCLAGQTDQDFELIIIGHSPETESIDFTAVHELCAHYQPFFDRAIQFAEVRGGKRAKPLNESLAYASGGHVAFFDDDDLLFANWVENFTPESTHDHLIRQGCAVQRNRVEGWPMGSGFRAVSWPETPYPARFMLIDHMGVNKSPFMSVAFPQAFFANGFRFDEDLEVCEDWDAILAAASQLPVTSVEELGSIYRLWEGIETSYTVHHETDWEASANRVIAKLTERPMLLPLGEAKELHNRMLFYQRTKPHSFLFNEFGFRKPYMWVLRLASPFIRIAVRLRNFVRRAKKALRR